MITIGLAEVSRAVQGTVVADSTIDLGAEVTGNVVIDSRAVQPGDLFVAIVGENHDGHDYVASAFESGAVAAVVERPLPGATILVDDSVRALGDLAREVLCQVAGITVVAITGSSGKTSTKDLLAQVLAADGPTVSPVGSFNNEVGLPLTVLGIDRYTKYLVLEMGARGVGHVAALCRIAPPDIAVVLNVGSAHLGEFGSTEVTAAAKAELVTALGRSGTAILNADDSRVLAMAVQTSAEIVTFGVSPDADVRLIQVELDESARPQVCIRTADGGIVAAQLQVHGAHHGMNTAAVVAVAVRVGLAPGSIADALSNVKITSRWRMEVTTTADGSVVVNDAYNANPESMAAALHALVAMSGGHQTWAVLGQMRELGDGSVAAHEDIGKLAAQLGVSRLVGVGEGARPILVGGVREGYCGAQAQFVPDLDAAALLLADEMTPGDVVVIKASRAIGLERLAAAVIADHGGGLAVTSQ